MPTTRPTSLTFGALLREIATVHPGRDAVVFADRRVSYSELDGQVDAHAKGLMALGLKHGDRLALLMGNRLDWVVVALAAARIGVITTAISTFSTPRELAWTLDHSEAGVLVTVDRSRSQDFIGALDGMRSDLPALHHVVRADEGDYAGTINLAKLVEAGSAVTDAELAAAEAAVGPDDLCYILYTSGSTAAPKGVTLAHGHTIANGFDIGERMHLTEADRVWLAVPLFWSFGSANAFPALLSHGGALVLQESFEPGPAIDLIERERCTLFYGMANMIRAFAEHPDYSLARMDSMRTGLTIGVPEDVQLTIDVLGAAELCNVYGSTETYGNCAVTDAGDSLELRLSSQGDPLPGMVFRVIDQETGADLPVGEIGEMCVTGYITPGYFRAPEMNAETFDERGYFHTGDLGRIDELGRVRYHGRLKEMIKTGGVNVAPLEVEKVLMQHPSVKQAYVVGIPDRERGELVAAVIEAADGHAPDADALQAHCKELLSRYKVPGLMQFRATDEFPRTPTGKIHKPGLREELSAGR